MRTIFFIIQKEFKQVFRNKTMLPIIFIVPVIQLFILSYAATFEMKNIKIHIVDMDKTPFSRDLISKYKGSKFFKIVDYTDSYNLAEDNLKVNKADVILNIPENFEKKIVNNDEVKLQLVINAINGSAAGLIFAYSSAIIRDFNRNIIIEKYGNNFEMPINTVTSFWYNPQLDYKTYMIPGILVLLVTLIGLFLSSMNVVREKELGTIEQITVTPIHKYQFIIGKIIPFWIIAMFELFFGLLFAKLVFSLPILGNLAIIFVVAAVYIIAVLGLGILISTITNTQQQAMFISWFFMVIFILMSGLFTPVESMPEWAKTVNIINPISYFIKVMRMVILKGSGFKDILPELFSLFIYAILSISFAIKMFKKTN